MKFTLVITTYNSESYIESAIQSVLNLSRRPDEIIICDDNSIDGTIEICNKYLNEISLQVNKNGPSGYNNAFNRALKLGSGDYVTILHYDDLLHPDFLSYVDGALNEYPECRFLYVGCNYIDNKNNEIKSYYWPKSDRAKKIAGVEYAKKYLKSISSGNHIHRCPGVVIHKSLLNDGMFFREEAGIINDDDFFLRIGKFTDVLGIDYPLASVRIHGESETGKLRNLALQLANDWTFQYEEYVRGNTILDNESGQLILCFAFNDLTTALNIALRMNSDAGIEKIKKLLEKLEKLSGEKIEDIINFNYRKLLWKHIKKEKLGMAKVMNETILLGRKIKSLLK
jgi:glycosyltransferase involved in cell wall biosynthesis